MNHNISVIGLGYSIRPVTEDDASFIVNTRLEDAERNKFIHKISPDIYEQKEWIRKYLEKENDYYFVLKNNVTDLPEGLIGIYNINPQDRTAEWGRWVIKKGSLGAIESVDLICQAAFNIINLKEIYSHTIEDNKNVVSFHNSAKEKFRKIIPSLFEVNDITYNAVEHYITADYYKTSLKFILQEKAQRIYLKNLKTALGDFEFHHMGIACTDLDKETQVFSLLGYRQEFPDFKDKEQGIIGRFLVAHNQPRIELLVNSESSNTLNYYLKQRTKIYHIAYEVNNFDKTIKLLIRKKAKIIKEEKISNFFKKRIIFFVFKNMHLIELIEK